MVNYKRVKPRKRKFKDNKILLLFLLLMCIGIGYAALTTTLSINGTTNVATNSWNIHFANLQIKNGSVAGSPAASLSGYNMNITYGAELQNPGDYYEFTVDVVNEGTLPGKVSIVNLTGNNTEYLSTSYKYSNGKDINIGDILNAGKSKKLTIKAWIAEDIDISLLPSADTPITLTFNLQYIQSEEDAPPDATKMIINLASTNSCIEKYTGDVTDSVGVTNTAENVYFNKCEDKRNIIFNNMCWKMIRTTETGGIKMIYNGEVVDGKCESSRGDHKGIVGATGSTQTLNGSYLYGSSFTYDTTNNTFTLVDTITSTWSDSTYENLIGKYTCRNTTETCTTIYNVNSYSSNTTAYTSSYTIRDTNYAQIGDSPFNANNYSPAMVGYMFNKVYNYVASSPPTSGSLMGNDVSYSNGTYTLLPADGETELGTTKDSTHHYTCNNTTGTCSKVRYYYKGNYYIELDGVTNIEAAVNEMLYNDDVNKYNSNIKGIIDNWYAQNLSDKTYMLEDTVFCNSRNMTNQNITGWNKDGSLFEAMLFKNNDLSIKDLTCANLTDQFALENEKAKLIYPVGLLQNEDGNNTNIRYNITGEDWVMLAILSFGSNSSSNNYAYIRIVSSSGGNTVNSPVYYSYGIRPVVSLASGNTIVSGSGSMTDPWIIEE